MAKDYIPRPINDFFEFQKNLVSIVAAKAGTWNIPAAEVSALSASSVAYGNHYKIISVKGSRTRAQVTAHTEFRTDYESDLRLFVNGFLRNNKNVSLKDKVDMRLKVRDKRRKQRSAIETSPGVSVECFPGAFLKFVCRVEGKEGRASIHSESDGIEICFSIGAKPSGFDNCTHTYFSKKAYFRMNIKEEWRGKMFYGFMRWKNLSNEELSGPFSGVVMQMVY